MNVLKLITYFNWLVIAVLGYLVAAETLFPAKGGDAAGRGIGQAIYYLAIMALVVLVVLNLLPFVWAKYTAFGLVVFPILLWKISPIWSKAKQNLGYLREESKPIFEDKAREQVARAIRDGQPEKLKKLLESPLPNLNEGGELLGYAVSETASTAYKPAEKLECIRMLFQAGARLDSTQRMDVPIHMFVAEVGNAALLRLLLEQGADANAVQIYFNRPILFEAIGSYQDPEATVRLLLDFGADPNSRATFEEEDGPVSPLFRAAQLGRWNVCMTLLEKGADPAFKASSGRTFLSLFEAAAQDFSSDGYSKREDFERLKETLK